MRVLQINATYGYGSTGMIVQDIGDTLVAHGDEVFFAYQSTAQKMASGYQIGNKLDWKLHALWARILGKQAYASKGATKKLLQWMDEIQPDIVHLHNLHSNYIHLNTLCDYLEKKKIPTIITLHDCWYFTGKCSHYAAVNCDKWKTCCGECPLNKSEQSSWIVDCTAKVLQEKTARLLRLNNFTIVGCSKWIAGEARQSKLQSANIQVVYNGVDTSIFTPHESNFRKELGLAADQFVVLGMADKWSSLQNRAMVERLLKSLPQDTKVVIVGCNKAQKSYFAKYENVIPLGYIADRKHLSDVYAAANVFVNLTHADTLPTVNMESICCGTPVVTFDCCGSPELVGDGCGYVVKENDVDALMEKINQIRKIPLRYDVLAQQKKFDKNESYKEYLTIYEGMCKKAQE